MTWASAYNGWGPAGGAPEKDMSIGGSGANDGNPITLDGLVYPKGLGMHPSSTQNAEAVYSINGSCSGKLIADVGVDDEIADTNTQASVTFEVWLDGVKAYDSGVMYANTFRKAVAVSVAGKNQLKLVVTNAGINGNSNDHADWANLRVTGCTGSAPLQSAFPSGTPWPVPGTIQAEDYDKVSSGSGEGITYHDTTAGNSGALYRTDAVDIQASGDAGGGYNIGWAAAGEWLEYTLNVASAGSYTMNLRVATTAARTMHVEMDGAALGGSLTIPSTGSYQTYTTVTTNVTLTAGVHMVKVVFDTGSVNLNWISFTAQAGCTAETNAQFCSRLGATCGTLMGSDNCGAPRTVTSCGSCTSPQTCGGGGTPNVCGASQKIASLTVFDTANAASWSIQNNFQAGTSATGSHPWTDWPNTYVSAMDSGISSSLAGREWIRVAAASKSYTGGPQASIALNGTADVYLMVDDRWNGGARPSWLDTSWVDTGFAVTVWESTSKPSLLQSVYKKAVASGNVTTPQIGANTAYDYFIVVN
jgi:hypothetical protein